MPLSLENVSCVGLIIDGGGTPIGTGFVVQKENEQDSFHKHNYFVTAKHVVEDEIGVSVRFRRVDGSIENESALDWHHHPAFDVSAAPIPDRERPDERVRAYGLPIDTRVVGGDNDLAPVLGTAVYYAGLFDPGKALSEMGVPVVRSGTLAAWYAPVERDDGTDVDVLHLVDCRSYDGFSGSPCWVQFAHPGNRAPGQTFPPWWSESDIESRGIGSIYFDTVLLGMVIEHYRHRKSPGELASKIGMALVIPVDCILDLLRHPDFIKQRSRDLTKRREETDEGEVEREKLSTKKGSEEFDAFDDLTKKLVNETVYVVLECKVKRHEHEPLEDTDVLELKQVLVAQAATLVDEELVGDVIDRQKDAIKRARDAASNQGSMSTELLERQHNAGEHRELVDGCPICDSEREAEADEKAEK